MGDGGDGADLGMAAEASNNEGSEVFPRDEVDEVLSYFFQGFLLAGSTGFRCFG